MILDECQISSKFQRTSWLSSDHIHRSWCKKACHVRSETRWRQKLHERYPKSVFNISPIIKQLRKNRFLHHLSPNQAPTAALNAKKTGPILRLPKKHPCFFFEEKKSHPCYVYLHHARQCPNAKMHRTTGQLSTKTSARATSASRASAAPPLPSALPPPPPWSAPLTLQRPPHPLHLGQSFLPLPSPRTP